MKNYFMVVDTETTQDNLVADFGAIVCDKKGAIVASCAVLVQGIYNNRAEHPLFHSKDANPLWGIAGLPSRYANYDRMLDSGSRMLASPAAINAWVGKAISQYNPVLTAYNLPFDLGKCANTGIDLTVFQRSFCLWGAAYTAYAHTKAYRRMALALHAFNTPTEHGNMTFKTNAETMARFCTNMPFLEDEPHTAYEDAVFYELPILKKLLRSKSVKWLLNETGAYNWRDCQVRDNFKV